MAVIRLVFTVFVAIVLTIVLICGAGVLFLYLINQKAQTDEKKSLLGIPKSIILTSTAFENGDFIPEKYAKLSPPLAWKNVPAASKSLVIIVSDSDAPSPKFKLFTPAHWVVFNISPETKVFQEGVKLDTIIPAKFGKNVYDQKEYSGPKPPFGVHNYTFRIYATTLDYINPTNPTKDQILKLISSKSIAYGELVGKYGKE